MIPGRGNHSRTSAYADSSSDFRIRLDLALSGGKMYGVPYIFRYCRERFSSKNTSKSRFYRITRPHKCTSQLTLEGSRSALVVIFESVWIWRLLGENNVWGSVYFSLLQRTVFVHRHVNIEIFSDHESPQMHLSANFRRLQDCSSSDFQIRLDSALSGRKNIWGSVYFSLLSRTVFVQTHVKIEICPDHETPQMHLSASFRRLQECSSSDFRIRLDLALSGKKMYRVPYSFRYFRERFSSKITSKSRFLRMTRPHKSTSPLTLEGSRSALVAIFESVAIWRFLGKNNVWASIYFSLLQRTGFVQKHVKIEIFPDHETPQIQVSVNFRRLQEYSSSDFLIRLDLTPSGGKLYGVPYILRYF